MAVLISAAIVLFFVFIIFGVARSGAWKFRNSHLSGEDFFSNMAKISSDVRYFAEGAFTKSIEMRMMPVSDTSGFPLMIANANLSFFTRITKRLDLSTVNGAIVADLSPGGRAFASARGGRLYVRYGGENIGIVDLESNKIFSPSNVPIGRIGRTNLLVNGADILGLPVIGRRGNFHINYSVFFNEQLAATINMRKWPDYLEPLFQNLNQKLSKTEMVIITMLAAFEWALSVNLREG